jgi:hypothetical protein
MEPGSHEFSSHRPIDESSVGTISGQVETLAYAAWNRSSNGSPVIHHLDSELFLNIALLGDFHG